MMNNFSKFIESVLACTGGLWLGLEPYYFLTNTADEKITFFGFLSLSIVLAIIWFLINGFFFSGFLKNSLVIKSNGFDTKIHILFGDLFKQDGWSMIAVNEYFDSKVDEKHVASNSLHGVMLSRYWAGNTEDFDKQVQTELRAVKPLKSNSKSTKSGNTVKYPVGTTAAVNQGEQKFLCVVLTKTDPTTLKVSADSLALHKSLRGGLCKARTICAGKPLNIPLIGSGIAGTGIKTNIIVDLILLAIFEETKSQKITNEIRIILPIQKKKDIDLVTLQKDWQ
ncbi:MAG: hypothetical protein CME33_15455 [Gimesia sp.]|uniref:macro domain-containing protein n=1 Tax=Gimesia sp. TaxID=2024833 RepID=UPI000C40E1EA|nr:macro domain-containing protein [Gimesia sp.]MAX37951.1 hypothetical protein [Gimesia sp.]|tara:strand:+ start:459 stop:1301 length:843 start_codon:yes stop_codon:yes gene_type:complete